MNQRHRQLPPDDEACPDPELFVRHIAQPLDVSEEDSERLVEHLFDCPECADLYGALCDVAEQFYEDNEKAEGRAPPPPPRMTNEGAINDFWRRVEIWEIQRRGSDGDRRRTFRVGKAAAAIAACLLLIVGIFWRNRATTPRPTPTGVAASQQPSSENKMALSGENPLGDVSALIIPEPALFDPATTNYEKWLEEHRESLVANGPWISKVCSTLQAVPASR